MDQHLVFAISREYGSGGREIGERLASELGIAYYDKLLLKRIAEESGLSGDVVEDFDEKPMRPLLLNPNSFFCGTDIEHPVASRIYKTEVDILRSIANEGPCVIVGRCADYVLEGHPGLVSLFVSAPMEARVARVMRRNNLSESDARSRIARVDKNRASYYRYFTDENWGAGAKLRLVHQLRQLGRAGSGLCDQNVRGSAAELAHQSASRIAASAEHSAEAAWSTSCNDESGPVTGAASLRCLLERGQDAGQFFGRAEGTLFLRLHDEHLSRPRFLLDLRLRRSGRRLLRVYDRIGTLLLLGLELLRAYEILHDEAILIGKIRTREIVLQALQDSRDHLGHRLRAFDSRQALLAVERGTVAHVHGANPLTTRALHLHDDGDGHHDDQPPHDGQNQIERLVHPVEPQEVPEPQEER